MSTSFLNHCSQGQDMTVRQMALLSFRDLVLMKLPLRDLLPKNPTLLPAAITNMLLVLQVGAPYIYL